jgi:hypothetical protein
MQTQLLASAWWVCYRLLEEGATMRVPFFLFVCAVLESLLFAYTPEELNVAKQYVQFYKVHMEYKKAGGGSGKEHSHPISCGVVLANAGLVQLMPPRHQNWLKLIESRDILEAAVTQTWDKQIEFGIAQSKIPFTDEQLARVKQELFHLAVFSSIFDEHHSDVTGENHFFRVESSRYVPEETFDPHTYALEEWAWRFPLSVEAMVDYLSLIHQGFNQPGFKADEPALPCNLTDEQTSIWNARIKSIRQTLTKPPEGYTSGMMRPNSKMGGRWRLFSRFPGDRVRLFPDRDPAISRCCGNSNEYFCQYCPTGCSMYTWAKLNNPAHALHFIPGT